MARGPEVIAVSAPIISHLTKTSPKSSNSLFLPLHEKGPGKATWYEVMNDIMLRCHVCKPKNRRVAISL